MKSLEKTMFGGSAFTAMALTMSGAASAQAVTPETTTPPVNTPTGAATPNEGGDVAAGHGRGPLFFRAE
jgi:hypothetical protein